MRYTPASDEKLRENGWDPAWIAEGLAEREDEVVGPYIAAHVTRATCPCCGGATSGWQVLDMRSAVGIGTERFGDNAQCDAEEDAAAFNAAWRSAFDDIKEPT